MRQVFVRRVLRVIDFERSTRLRQRASDGHVALELAGSGGDQRLIAGTDAGKRVHADRVGGDASRAKDSVSARRRCRAEHTARTSEFTCGIDIAVIGPGADIAGDNGSIVRAADGERRVCAGVSRADDAGSGADDEAVGAVDAAGMHTVSRRAAGMAENTTASAGGHTDHTIKTGTLHRRMTVTGLGQLLRRTRPDKTGNPRSL